MNAGKNYAKAKAQARANADRSGEPRWLHWYSGAYWISRTPVRTSDAERIDPRAAGRHHAQKKSPSQLDREIAEALNGHPGEVDEVARMRQRKTAAAAKAPTRSATPSQAEYERRELADAHRKLDELRRAPLSERKEAQAEFLQAMREHPDVVAERIGWLFAGNYGYGPMVMAKRVLGSPRMNRPAALTQMVGAFEWMTPEDMVRAAWKKLTAGEKAALEAAVQAEISEAESAE